MAKENEKSSQATADVSNKLNGYNGTLGSIKPARPLILFPLRLETSFCKGKGKKQLRVRIIPDEIMLDYKKNAKLTQEEIDDGKFFWTQWFIASGCEKREKEAWDVLCSKYPLYKTAWICDTLRPDDYEKVCRGGDYYYRRPYAYRGDGDVSSCIEDIENKCKTIYDIVGSLNYDEKDLVANYNEETAFERGIRTGLGKINSFIFDIESQLQSCQYIVDYLYDTVYDAFSYLQNHLQVLDTIYNNRSQLKEARSLELWDIDYSILTSVLQKTVQYLENIQNRRITLSDMVKMYQNEKKISFPVVEKREADRPIVPVCRCLPKKFLMIGEVANQKKDIVYAFSKDVKASDIQMGFSLDSNRIAEGIDLDVNGELALGPKMKWLTDYKVAEDLGMAITVSLDDSIKEFRYIYVVGVQTSIDGSILRDLFYGHNYINSNMRILKAGTPTNIVDQKYEDDENFLKDARYDIEVNGNYKKFSSVYATEEEIKELLKSIEYEKESFKNKHQSIFNKTLDEYKYKYYLDNLLKKDRNGTFIVDKENLYPTNSAINEYNKLENFVLSLVAYEDEKDQLKKDLVPLKKSIENLRYWFFDESDYDARKISYLFKGGKNKDCYNQDFLNCWSSIIESDSRQSYNAKIAYTAIWNRLIQTAETTVCIRNQPILDNPYLKVFFVNHVRARGNFASFRIDNMPYGILPITDFVQMSKFLEKSTDEMDKTLGVLLKILIKLAKEWRIIRNENAQWSEVLKGEKVQKKYLEMAGQSPYSNSFTQRVVVDFPRKKTPNSSLENRTIFDFLEKELGTGVPVADLYKEFDGVTEGVEDTKNKVFNELVNIVVKALNLEYHIEDSTNANKFKQEAKLFVVEFLDLFTYRIDAWFLGILDYFFHKNMRKIDTGCIGAFGWSFNLKEDVSKQACVDNRAQVINDMELGALKQSDTLLKAPSTAHFVTAPSIQHALSAAVLRSAFFNAKAKNKAVNSEICVNLSSTRVRQALRLVEGVKSGMSLSIVLGADFERYLHEAIDVYGLYMDEFIYSLRQVFPQVIQTKIEAEDNHANDYILQVVNGETILNSFVEDWGWNGSVLDWLNKNYEKNEKLSWVNQLENLDNDRRECLFKIIEQLMDSYDALNDLLLSEGVHRLIMGDKSSYRAICKFLKDSKGNLPDMNILNIPSEHVVVTHKAGVLLPQDAEIPDKVLCHAEPALNAWVENQLGGMENILVFIQKNEGETREFIPCSLKDLGVSGIEYMYLSSFDKVFHAYLEARFRTSPKFCTSECCYTENIIILDSAVDAGYECLGNQISLDDNKLRIEAVRGLVGHGRAMNAADWCNSACEDKSEEELIDVENLSNRLKLSVAKLEYLRDNLEKWLDRTAEGIAIENSLVAQAYTLLCDCFESGMINSFNQYDTSVFLDDKTQSSDPLEYDRICNAQQELRRTVQNALISLKNRMDEAQNMVSSKTVESYVSALQAITLSNFKVCYKFKTELVKGKFQNSLNNSFYGTGKLYSNVSVESFDQWQDEVSEVREGMKLMHQLCMTQLALDHELDKVAILQTSIPDGQIASNVETDYKKWMGVAVELESELRDADSLVLYNSSASKSETSGGLSGFVFDSWIEYIPYKKHDAGIAFHNDWPDNEAPQTILVAWHPKVADLHDQNDGGWNLDILMQIIRTTRFMMMNRAVDPDYLYGDKVMSKCFPLIPIKG